MFAPQSELRRLERIRRKYISIGPHQFFLFFLFSDSATTMRQSVGWLCRRATAADGARASFCGARLSTSAIKTPVYADYLSERSRARQPSAIRALQPLLAEPGMISLGGGMPNPETFPFDEISVGIRGGGDLAEGADSGNGTFTLRGAALESVLQYSSTRGLPSLVAHLEALQREHGRPT